MKSQWWTVQIRRYVWESLSPLRYSFPSSFILHLLTTCSAPGTEARNALWLLTVLSSFLSWVAVLTNLGGLDILMKICSKELDMEIWSSGENSRFRFRLSELYELRTEGSYPMIMNIQVQEEADPGREGGPVSRSEGYWRLRYHRN